MDGDFWNMVLTSTYALIIFVSALIGIITGWLLRDWLDGSSDDSNGARPPHVGKYGDGFPGCLLVLPEIVRSLLKR